MAKKFKEDDEIKSGFKAGHVDIDVSNSVSEFSNH